MENDQSSISENRLVSLVLILFSVKKAGQKSLGIWAGICLAAMIIGPVGTGLLTASALLTVMVSGALDTKVQ